MAKRRSDYYDDRWPQYETRGPIRVSDGIRAKSQHGKFVKSWWADRWIEALAALMDPARLSRGRNYARQGQVREINVAPGRIDARVQGSRPVPYRVNIQLSPLDDKEWDKVFDALAEQAIFAAQLLSGEMPPDIEQVFQAVQVPLFPSAEDDLRTECSCPDWANPCKHIAAVYYLLGERFDEDPFLLFELRGRSKGDIAAALRERRAQGEVREEATPYTSAIDRVNVPALGECLDRYWALGIKPEDLRLDIRAPTVEMALLKQLGMPAFLDARGHWAQIEQTYRHITRKAIETAFTDTGESRATASEEG